ncbi:sensor histidine kinase [Micromonospora endolithica]|uniref:sensor histidine kinase n=1 Tax=Micromonospora endolithica TaxID=230091 RepID=UPI001EDEADA4|nr:sensor histidine kinase [Micromonospora endolithica]
MSGPGARPENPGWADRFWLWDAYFAVTGVGVGTVVVADPRHPGPARLGVAVLFVALGAWYLAFGRPLMRDGIENWRGYVYLAGVVVLYVPAVLLSGSTSFLLFALCPQAFMVLPAAPAVVAVVLLNAVHVGVLAVRARDLAEVTAPLLIAALVVVVVSMIGIWSQRTVAESDRRAELIAELNRSRDEVARLSRQAGVTAERQRLAADIHDTVAQGLSSVVMLIQAADADLDRDPSSVRRHLGLAVDTARDSLAEVRALVAALTPGALTASPLAQALHRLVERFGRETGLAARCTAGGAIRPLGTSIEVVLLRATQEALANVRRHAAAGAVTVRLDHGPDTVVLQVVDDGAGFDQDDTGDGYGLAAMRARVAQVRGTLTVRSGAGEGTTIRVEVPYS